MLSAEPRNSTPRISRSSETGEAACSVTHLPGKRVAGQVGAPVPLQLESRGVLFLGSAETIGEFTDLFSVLDRNGNSINAGNPVAKQHVNYSLTSPASRNLFRPAAGPGFREVSIAELARKTLLEPHDPSRVLVNEKGDILYIHGRTGKLPGTGPRPARMNILEMAREGCAFELRAALHQAVTQQETSSVVPLEGQGQRRISPTSASRVKPLSEPEGLEGYAAWWCSRKRRPRPWRQKPAGSPRSQPGYGRTGRGTAIRQGGPAGHHRRTAAANEELKSANEELQSTNEELQSTNEEMETSKEEIQSVNEELLTVNAELQAKMENLYRAESDMKNLLDSTRSP